MASQPGASSAAASGAPGAVGSCGLAPRRRRGSFMSVIVPQALDRSGGRTPGAGPTIFQVCAWAW